MSHCEQKAHENGEKGVRQKAAREGGREDDGLENRRSFLCPEKGGPTKGPRHLPGKSIGEGERTKLLMETNQPMSAIILEHYQWS